MQLPPPRTARALETHFTIQLRIRVMGVILIVLVVQDLGSIYALVDVKPMVSSGPYQISALHFARMAFTKRALNLSAVSLRFTAFWSLSLKKSYQTSRTRPRVLLYLPRIP